MDDRADAGPAQRLEAVGEREEGIARSHGPSHPIAGTGDGQLGRLDPGHLAGPNAQRHLVAHDDDGVGFDVAADPPGHQQVAPLRLGRLPLGCDGHRAPVRRHPVAGLHQQPSAQAAHVEGGGAVGTVQDQDAKALAARQPGGGILIGRGADDDLQEGLGQLLGGGEIECAVERHDPAVGRSRVAGVGAAIGIERGVPGGESARVGVLDHGGSRFSELGN